MVSSPSYGSAPDPGAGYGDDVEGGLVGQNLLHRRLNRSLPLQSLRQLRQDAKGLTHSGQF